MNTRIQLNFLESLRKLSDFFDIGLVVTQWQESGVKEALENSGIDFILMDLDEVIPFYRYSLSTVLAEGFKRADGDVIIYTTCDVELTQAFFKRVELDLLAGSILIPFPYLELAYSSSKGIKGGVNASNEITEPTGIDTFVFSRDAVEKLINSIFFSRYRFLGWGMFDHLIILACLRERIPIINIHAIGLMCKFHNDRLQNRETSSWMDSSHKLNSLYFKRHVGLRIKFLRLLKINYLIKSIRTNEVDLKEIRLSEKVRLLVQQTILILTFSKSRRSLLRSLPME